MMLPLILFVLFVVVPILEIAAFIKIGAWIGVVPTLLGCVVTAILGAFLVRLQGFGVLRKVQTSLARQELPVDELAHGVMILAAGALLMTPGYVTDTMGFLLLIPPVRTAIARGAKSWLRKNAEFQILRPDNGETYRRGGDGLTIDGEAVDITDKNEGSAQ